MNFNFRKQTLCNARQRVAVASTSCAPFLAVKSQQHRALLTVCSQFFQPKPKSPRTLSLLYCRYVYDRLEKTICHQGSKTVILKKRIFYTKNWVLMAFFSHVYRSEFWKPDDRWFFQLILICLIYTCNIKVKKSMDFLVWVGKTRGTL